MSLTVQLNTMLMMTAMGIWLGVAIDTYGRFVRNRKWYTWVYIINDCLFWLLQALLIFYVLLLVNQGEMRFYILLALLLGYATYRALLQNIYQQALERLIRGTILTIKFCKNVIVALIINPTKYLLKVLYALCMIIVSWLLVILSFMWKCIYIPLKWFGNLLVKLFWRVVPKEKLKKLKNKAGFYFKLKNVKSVVKNWFTRKKK